ncbi:phenylalanine--tRNA ligase subunit beta, partial [Candidatus Saccharibacteria bacterium]|nr:phenylalanine--tRNA ligase subunit beta [Candidatus Saccharibacteria bacterium]
MKISLNWIQEFTDLKLGIDELVTKIGAQLGEVDEVINIGERYEGIVTAKVVGCDKHPNADKLSVCKIDDGNKVKNVKRDEDGLVQVVCGAPNVRKGITIAWIPPGAIVPSTFDGEKFTLEVRELRGVMSNGMIASGKELDINDSHDGILILDKPCENGTPILEVYKLDDYIIDVENKMFTHRPDCFGQLGVAREIAGIQGIEFKSPEWYREALDAFKQTSDKKLEVIVDNKLPELVPRFTAIAMSDIQIMKSPIMIQSFLRRVGVKPINNIVDITNFVMMLTAQPMHAYDYDKLLALDNTKTANIVVRKPKKGEKLLLLDGKTVEPRQDAICIASKGKLIGLGGVMGGAETEVDDNTQNIILECANFDMYSIRRTAMEHGVFTEAVTRFNKGQSPLQNKLIMAYAVAWVKKLANGQAASKLSDETKPKNHNQSIKITKEFINERLGSDLNSKDISTILRNVEFTVESTGEELRIKAPFWRTDIEIQEDIVEEVGRLHGYDKLPIELPKRGLDPASSNKLIKTKQTIREVLSAAGANEVLTYSFVHGKLFEQVGQDKKLAYQLNNALSPDLQYYRLSLLPSLLDKIHANIKAGHGEFAIYEVNKTHDKTNIHPDGLPVEEERVALVFAADSKSAKHYAGSP